MSITDKKPVPKKICPICGESFPARGIHGHIRQAHGADEAEAWRAANRIAVNKELEAKYPRSTGKVVQALADPGSVLSEAFDSPESAPPSIQQKRAVELSHLKKNLKSISGSPRFLRGKNAAEIALDEVEKAEENVKRDLKKASPADAQRKEEVDKAEEKVKRDLKKASPADAPCEPSVLLPIDWFRGKINPGTPDNATISAVVIKPNKFFEKIFKVISGGVICYIIVATLLSGKKPGKPSGGFKVRGLESLSKF